ncbi:MAG: hypothetical protein AAGC53_03700 [Actinomycetota bacterium]
MSQTEPLRVPPWDPENPTVEQFAPNPGERANEAGLDVSNNELLESYETWNTWVYSSAGAVLVIADVVKREVHGKAEKIVMASCHALYDALSSMSHELVKGIHAIQGGKTLMPSFGISTVPPWPDDGKLELFPSAWAAIKPVLITVDESLAGNDPNNVPVLATALAGVIRAGDQVAQDLESAFKSNEGQ